jgi:hypothetical protein
MINIVAAEAIKLLNLSRIPPWPGNQLLKSLTLWRRLYQEDVKSPDRLEIAMMQPIKKGLYNEGARNECNPKPSSIAQEHPPTAPSMVFAGLIVGASLWRPKSCPVI